MLVIPTHSRVCTCLRSLWPFNWLLVDLFIILSWVCFCVGYLFSIKIFVLLLQSLIYSWMLASCIYIHPSIPSVHPSVHPSIRPLPTHARTYPQFILYRFAFKYSSDSFPTLHIPHDWLTYQLIIGRFVHYFFMSLFICSFPLFHENEFLGSIIGLLSQTCLLALLLTYTHSFLLGRELAGAMRSHSI